MKINFPMCSRNTALFLLAIVCSMVLNVFHPYLWGPDEPREAEIAREMFVTGNYVSPSLCGIPFVEKPPLFHAIIAGAFHIFGIHAWTARMVSALFGLLIIGLVFYWGNRWKNIHCAAFSAIALLNMPQFYRTAHWILLDIGCAFFIIGALFAFASRLLKPEPHDSEKMTSAFYLMSAGAFLTKGFFGIFQIGLVCLVYAMLRKRWDLLWQLIWNRRILFFVIPVAAWIIAFHQDGGWYYIHEHFINNTFGRLIGRNLTLPGSPVLFTDVGLKSPWYFYLKRLPEMFGGMLFFLPFALYAALVGAGMKTWHGSPNTIKGKIAVFLNGKTDEHDEFNRFLLIWFLAPVVVLSFSSIKEVTYILPSYAAMALLIGRFIETRLPTENRTAPEMSFSTLTMIFAFTIAALAPFSRAGCVAAVVCIGGYAVIRGISLLKRRDYRHALFLLFAIMTAGVILGNTPHFMLRSRLSRKCFMQLADEVWKFADSSVLYIYQGDESLRGSIPFYGNKTTSAIRERQGLETVLKSDVPHSVILDKNAFRVLMRNEEISGMLSSHRIIHLDHPELCDDFVMILSNDKHERLISNQEIKIDAGGKR